MNPLDKHDGIPWDDEEDGAERRRDPLREPEWLRPGNDDDREATPLRRGPQAQREREQ